jgi:hypothetical protein
MSKQEIINELKRLGWKRNRGGWKSPYHRRIFQCLSLREAASLEGLEANENLG